LGHGSASGISGQADPTDKSLASESHHWCGTGFAHQAVISYATHDRRSLCSGVADIAPPIRHVLPGRNFFMIAVTF
jgi:hypothetical protein